MLPKQCHRLWVTAKAAHFTGQLPTIKTATHLKALGILRWNMGSDIKRHEIQSRAMVLIDVLP